MWENIDKEKTQFYKWIRSEELNIKKGKVLCKVWKEKAKVLKVRKIRKEKQRKENLEKDE